MKQIAAFLVLLLVTPSVLSDILISEIMYNPLGSDTGKEWIELYNSGELPIEITEWKFRENDVNHGLTLYQGKFIIQSGDFLIIARNGDSFMTNHLGYSGNIAVSSFSLKNSGEELSILDANLNQVDSVNYSNIADEGHSIAVIDYNLDNNNMANWKEGGIYGNPGKINIIDSQDKQIPEFTPISVLVAILGMFWIAISKKNIVLKSQ